MSSTTRYLCPLDCGWHHDQPDPDLSDPDVVYPYIAQDWATGIDGIAAGFVAGRAAVIEEALKAHLETHSLVEWVTEVARLQRELNRTLATGGILSDGIVWGEGGPDCGMFPARPRQRSEAVQRQVRDLLGRTPVMAVELMHFPTTPDGPTVTGGFDMDIEVPELDAEGMPLPTPATQVSTVAAPATRSEEDQAATLARIRQAWIALDYAGDRLAAVGMDHARWRQIVDGERRPTSLDFALIAEAFEKTVDWLLSGAVDESTGEAPQ